jgi:hydrogenase 3 maturation protease
LQNSWNRLLSQLLNQRIAEAGSLPRIAILGVGNLFRCDDAAGMLAARGLKSKVLPADSGHLLICETGLAPENWTGKVREFAPDIVLFIDAADMAAEAGTVQWIPEDSIDGMSASTHSLPLSMLARYLSLELGCKVALLGIQPVSNAVGETVSEEVLQGVNEVVTGLDEVIRTRMPAGAQA